MAPDGRRDILLRLAGLIRENLHEMALLDSLHMGSLDMGKLVQDAVTMDAPGSAHFFQWSAEAIAMANDTVYGLAASVWTDRLGRAIRVSEQLHAGTVSVNTVDALSAQTPVGGMKQSGSGRDLSLPSFDKYTALKTAWIKYKT